LKKPHGAPLRPPNGSFQRLNWLPISTVLVLASLRQSATLAECKMQAKGDVQVVRHAFAQIRKRGWLPSLQTNGPHEHSLWSSRPATDKSRDDCANEGQEQPASCSERLYRQVNVQPSTSGRLSTETLAGTLCVHVVSSVSKGNTGHVAGRREDDWTTFSRSFANAATPQATLPPGPSFQDFLQLATRSSGERLGPETGSEPKRELGPPHIPYLSDKPSASGGRVYFETYGCQMNVSDMETVLAIMNAAGFTERAERVEDADVIFIMTCAIRDNAERKVKSVPSAHFSEVFEAQ
jgi:hypothetical protein